MSFFLGVLVALVLGLAGGYGIVRVFGPDSGAEVAAAQETVGQLEQENARLEEELATTRSELVEARATAEAGPATDDSGLRDTISRQAGELDALTQQLADLSRQKQDVAATADRQADEIASLKAQIETLKDSASAGESRLAAELARLRDAVVPDLTAERDDLARQIEAANAQVATLSADKAAGEDRIAALQSELAKTQGGLAAAQQALAEAQAATGSKDQPADTDAAKGTTDTGEAAAALTPRDPQAVEAALRDAPGLEELTASDRQKLKDALVAGACVTTALEAVFDDVPILALRNLIRDLNSGC